MVIGSIIVAAVGIVCVVLGYLLWKKEKISLLHDYHYDNISEENRTAFCTLAGLGIIFVGIGLLLTAVILCITDSVWSFIVFAIGFAVGLILLLHAEKKYNSKQK